MHLVVKILEDDPDLVDLLDRLVDIPWFQVVVVDLLPPGALEKLMSDVLGQISIKVISKIFF